MIEAILVLIVSVGLFLAGKETQKKVSKAKAEKQKKELAAKEKEIHETVSSSDLQSLVDSNNAKLEGK